MEKATVDSLVLANYHLVSNLPVLRKATEKPATDHLQINPIEVNIVDYHNLDWGQGVELKLPLCYWWMIYQWTEDKHSILSS